MVLSIVQIGNSRGIRLPKTILDQCHITDKVEIQISGDEITLRAVKEVRAGWDEQMKLMHERGEDKMLLPDSIDADLDEWEW